MGINIKKLSEFAGDLFKYSGDGNVTFYSPIFAVNEANNIYITIDGTDDFFWEVNSENNISPKF